MTPETLFQDENFLNGHMPYYFEHVRQWFRSFNDVIGEALVDCLERRTSTDEGVRLRKDGYTPYARHLLDQSMYTFFLIDYFGIEKVPLRYPMRVARLNVGHDHLEDLYEDGEAELISELKYHLGIRNGGSLEEEIFGTVDEIRIMSKHLFGQPDECSEHEFHWRVLQNPNTSAAKPIDHIHNGSSKTRIFNKSIAEQAEDADRVSRLMLYPIYPGDDSYLRPYKSVAAHKFPDQSIIYDILEKKLWRL